MKRLEFNYDYDLVAEIESLLENADDNYLISVYGKYDIIKVILEDLITEGFSIANEIELEDYNISHYDKEFVLYISEDGINVEKIYNNGYLYGSGDISFVHEDCSSTLLKYIDSDKVYEFWYINGNNSDEEPKMEHEYIVNGKKVTKETFDEYVSKYASNNVEPKGDESDNEGYSISVKCSLDADDALKIITDMESLMIHMNDIFHEMDCFRRLFNW